MAKRSGDGQGLASSRKTAIVTFTPEELSALEEAAQQTSSTSLFMPAGAIDPIYLRQALLPGPGQARRQAVQPAGRGHAQDQDLRAGQMVLEGQAVHGADPRGKTMA